MPRKEEAMSTCGYCRVVLNGGNEHNENCVTTIKQGMTLAVRKKILSLIKLTGSGIECDHPDQLRHPPLLRALEDDIRELREQYEEALAYVPMTDAEGAAPNAEEAKLR